MELSTSLCAMGSDPHVSCYIPLGGMAAGFILAAWFMIIPILLEFRGEARWMMGLLVRVRHWSAGAARARHLPEGASDLIAPIATTPTGPGRTSWVPSGERTGPSGLLADEEADLRKAA